MSEPKFTKGPWLIAMESPTFVYSLGPQETNVFWCDVQSAGKERASKDECRANAHLIAAAPELYEALGDALSIIVSMHDDPEVINAYKCHYDMNDLQKMHDALAKARGESQ